jgi:glucosyl-dolichyl phosphate glucuronosyltransferase
MVPGYPPCENAGVAPSSRAVSVVIACHTMDRWQLLVDAIESAATQRPAPEAIVVSVDHAPELFRSLVRHYPDLRIVENRFSKGASGTRNTGVAETNTPLVAFLDDDARARSEWLSRLAEPFNDSHVVGTGGFVAPSWSSKKPTWFPDEFGWVVGASHIGLPTERTPVRNVWSENMAVRRSAFDEVGGFRLDFGKVGNISRQEDTDLCIRMGKRSEGNSWIYVPDAIVDHYVGTERTHIRYFLKRSFLEGRGKIELARNNDGNSDLRDEQHYIRHTIPRGFLTYLQDGISSKQLKQFYKASALAGGVAAAGIGAFVSLVHPTSDAAQ